MTRVVQILAFDDMEVLDFAGPYEVFNVAGDLGGGAFSLHAVGVTPAPAGRGGFGVRPVSTPALSGPVLEDSPTPYTCPWKGAAQYHDVVTESRVFRNAAWSYPRPKASAIQRVGTDFSGYVAFDADQVTVAESGAG